MPSIPNSHWHVTINPAMDDGITITEELAESFGFWLDKTTDKRIVSFETGAKSGKPHLHCAFVLRQKERNDNLKRRIGKYLGIKPTRYSIKCQASKGTNLHQSILIAVAYVIKDGVYFNKGFDIEELRTAQARKHEWNKSVQSLMWCNKKTFYTHFDMWVRTHGDNLSDFNICRVLYMQGYIPSWYKDDDIQDAIRWKNGCYRTIEDILEESW